MRAFLILFSAFFLLAASSGNKVDHITYIKEYSLHQEHHSNYAVLIDMSKPSNEKRWFVVELASGKIIYQTYVAHGKGSGAGVMAEKFSDKPESYCTALGVYKITGTYIGEHGLSYSLEGLESSNKNAASRAIVIHSAWYVKDDFIASNHRCGNSWGCPAISPDALKACEPYLTPGTLLWIYR